MTRLQRIALATLAGLALAAAPALAEEKTEKREPCAQSCDEKMDECTRDCFEHVDNDLCQQECEDKKDQCEKECG